MDVSPPLTEQQQPQVPADRDVSQVDAAQYPARELPRIRDERGRGFQVVMTRSALNDMHRHGRSEIDVEVCGVIVGNVYRDDNGPYLLVEASIKGDHAAGKTAQVTFTADTWTHINDELERNHHGRRILGWYHTHPGFGIFLSEMDLFIQNNFFPEPWQVAYVYDPKSHEDGVFVWKNGQATRDDYLVDPDTINTDPPRAAAKSAEPTGNTLAELTGRVQALEHRTKLLLAAVVLVAVLAIAFPLAAPLLLPALHDADRDDPGGGAVGGGTRADPRTVEESDPVIPASLRPPPSTAPSSAGDPVSVEGPS
jgi:proteasome lid subunit RPN8/RPN11